MARSKPTYNDPYRTPKTSTGWISVRLACRCTVRVRSLPGNGTSLMCTAGLGHGYRVDWVSFELNGSTYTNRKLNKETS